MNKKEQIEQLEEHIVKMEVRITCLEMQYDNFTSRIDVLAAQIIECQRIAHYHMFERKPAFSTRDVPMAGYTVKDLSSGKVVTEHCFELEE